MLTLSKALKSGQIDLFVQQAEAAGIGPVDRAHFETVVERVTAPLPEGQTSHLPAGDCSPET